MYNYQRVIDISNNLIKAVDSRDGACMQKLVDELERAYKEEFGGQLDGYEAWHAFAMLNWTSARYFAYNNMFGLVHERYREMANRVDKLRESHRFTDEQIAEIDHLFQKLERIHHETPEKHQNLVVPRNDTRCCLCRVMPANKTGSHMVPNFLAHPTFSWDGKGKRFHEALNHDFLNEAGKNCQFYGREVPDWRFAKGEGKDEVTEEDIEKNVNQLEFDNEFCSHCEDRFGVLESAYSQFYNGQQKKMNPRVAYLFWLSVLWRMSMGSMSIYMDMEDELSLRRILDENIQDSAAEIAKSETDLGNWQYAIFRADGLRDGDKGIMGYRKECSPYVVMYNDLVMAFYHRTPKDDELKLGPILVERDKLNDWRNEERLTAVDRRWFMDVRDWMVETSYGFYDPVRERTLLTIREQERSEGMVLDADLKEEAIKSARLSAGPQSRRIRPHKAQRIMIAWGKLKVAEEKGEAYDPLLDEDLFLLPRDFDLYYQDLAKLSQLEEYHDKVSQFPFYKEARKAIPNERIWAVDEDAVVDKEYEKVLKESLASLSPKELDHLVNGVQEPYVNLYKDIGRNDPCPCGSGKKFKKCCGKN